MRRFVLALALCLPLAACGEQQPATVNESVGDATLTEEDVIPNDVTAIDAATADDSRMANDLAPPAADDNLVGNEAETENEA